MDLHAERVLLADLLRVAARWTHFGLARSSGWYRLEREAGEFHHGDDPIKADEDAQLNFEKAALLHHAYGPLRIRGIVGEERTEEIPTMAVGERVIVLDPLDGSKPWVMARQGFCVAALALRFLGESRWAVDAAIVATATEVFTLLGSESLYYGLLCEPSTLDFAITSALEESGHMPRSLAAVAWKPEDRSLVAPIIERLPDWSLLTLGGNPVIPYVITGAITAAITLKPTSTWDSVGILMASATDAVVGDHEGTLVSGPTFRELFAQVLLTGNVTPIPPMIVAKNYESYQAVVHAIQR